MYTQSFQHVPVHLCNNLFIAYSVFTTRRWLPFTTLVMLSLYLIQRRESLMNISLQIFITVNSTGGSVTYSVDFFSVYNMIN